MLSVLLEKSSDSEASVVPVVDVIGVEKLGIPRPAGAAFAAGATFSDDEVLADDAGFAVVTAFAVDVFAAAFAAGAEVFADAVCAGFGDAAGAAGVTVFAAAGAAGAGAAGAAGAGAAAGKAVRLIATTGNFSSTTTFFVTGTRITIMATMNQKPRDTRLLWMSLFLSDTSIVFILLCASSRR